MCSGVCGRVYGEVKGVCLSVCIVRIACGCFNLRHFPRPTVQNVVLSVPVDREQRSYQLIALSSAPIHYYTTPQQIVHTIHSTQTTLDLQLHQAAQRGLPVRGDLAEGDVLRARRLPGRHLQGRREVSAVVYACSKRV